MSAYSKLDGTQQLAFAFGGPTGVQAQNDQRSPPALGALAAYDATGQWYIPMRVGDAQLGNDAVTLSQLNAAFRNAGLPQPFSDSPSYFNAGASGLYEGSLPPPKKTAPSGLYG